MTLDELDWICDLFSTCNMSRSADNLYISQSALSQCVNRIEKQVGFPLFERSNKGLKPTEKGLIFADTAGQITKLYREFETRIDLMDHPVPEEIRIGMAPYLASICSADMIRKLNEQCPSIRFSVYDSYSKELLEMLDNREIHVIVTNSSIPAGKHHSVPFGKTVHAIFLRSGSEAAANSFVRHGRQYLDPRYLADEPIVITRKGQASRIAAEKVFDEAGISPKIIHETRNMSGLYKYALRGIGSSVGFLTREIRDEDTTNRLAYRIPETYENAFSQWQLLILKDLWEYLPQTAVRIIQDTVIKTETVIQ